MKRMLVLVTFLALSLGLSVAAERAVAAGPTNQECLGCHADKEMKKVADGKSVSLFVSEAALKKSVHGPLACTDCHTSITEVPHAEKVAPVQCQTCHDGEASTLGASIHGAAGIDCQSCHGTHGIPPAKTLGAQPCKACHQDTVNSYLQSVHGRASSQGVRDAARCFDCHGGAHQVRAQADPQSPTSRTRMAETCGRCHADRALVQRRQIPIPEAYQLYQKSVHGRAVAAGKQAATCNDCHRSHNLRRANDPASSVYRENVPQTCGKCHAQESKEYLGSIHGTAMRNGATDAPVCTDCHGEHLIRAPNDPESSVSVARVSKTCASCHEVARINEKYGIPGGRVETYADSFHGLAVRGGSTVAANCASCHGFHNIRSSSDPLSTIAKANLPTTCGKCHPGAGANFAEGQVHVALTARQDPLLFYVRNFYLLLIAATIGGMGLHNGLDFLQKLRREYHRSGGGRATLRNGEYDELQPAPRTWFLRMSVAERWQHGLLLVSFITLVYTGFALKFPEIWLFRWLVALEDGSALRGWIHRGAAVVLIASALWHLSYLPTRRGRSQLLAMLPKAADVKELLQNLGYLLGLRREPPRFGRFSYIEKAEYWALIWGTIVMAATGLVLWFENIALRFLPKWALDLATLVHYYEAWLATLAILIWHLYYVIFNPDVYPMNWTWLTGMISEEMLRHEHPREYEELLLSGTQDSPGGVAAGSSEEPPPPEGSPSQGDSA